MLFKKWGMCDHDVGAPGPDAARPQRPPRTVRGPPPQQSGKCFYLL